MLEMCQIVGDRNQLMTLLLLLAENVMNIILVHFQDRYHIYGTSLSFMAMQILLGLTSTGHCSSFECDNKRYSKDDLNLLCGKLISALERLELLSEVC